VNRAPGSLFVLAEDGAVRNTFLLRVSNTEPTQAHYQVAVHGLDGAQVTVADIVLAPEETRMVPLVVGIPERVAERTLPIVVEVSDGSRAVSRAHTFKTPGRL
jgi:polyferredoxin